jgi:site-specific recombinase XerD
LALETLSQRVPRTQSAKDTGSRASEDAISRDSGALVNCIEDFIALLVAKNRSPKTIVNYRQALRVWSQRFCAGRGITRIADYRLADHAVFLTGLQNRGLKGGTVELTNTLVRVFTKWCMKEGLIAKDPLADFDRTPTEKPLPKALPWELVDVHIGMVKSRYAIVVARDRFLIRLISRAGLRPGEALVLRRMDVDLIRRQLRLEGTKGHEATWQPYSDGLHPFLEEWLSDSTRTWPTAEWLFPSRTGKRLRLREVQAAFKGYGISTPHVYRHTYGTYMLEQGANVRDVQDMMRHKNINTTVRYLKVSDQRRRTLANLIK